MKKKKYLISQMYCTICKNRGIPIPRKKNKSRELGHKKTLYCVYCKKRTNHLEIRDFDFKEEVEERVY